MQTKQLDKTSIKIASMLKESTGKHFLDSGGSYSRHWQRNQIRDFESESATSLSFKYDYIELSNNIYHWLTERLEHLPELEQEFYQFDKDTDQEQDKTWFEQIPLFIEHLESNEREIVGGIYADQEYTDEHDLITVNTYNHESLLSQVILFTLVHIDDMPVYILQIHNGADVRGGYTKPAFFTDSGYSELALLMDSDGSIYCKDNSEHNWFTDDGHHFYQDGGTWPGSLQLESLELTDLDKSGMNRFGRAWAYIQAVKAEYKLQEPALYYDSDSGIGYCPLCGGELN